MTLEDIKAAVEAGKMVCWSNPSYRIIKDKLGQWLIYRAANEYCIGLTWRDDITLNGKEEDFYIAE
jgi:hypothetical protein